MATFDPVDLMMILPYNIQSWITVVEIKDPGVIQNHSKMIQLLSALYDLQSNSPSSDDESFNLISELPAYTELVFKDMIGEEEAGSINWKVFLEILMKKGSEVVTLIDLKEPTTMKQNTMVKVLNIITRAVSDYPRGTEQFHQVIVHLPSWIKTVCSALVDKNYSQ
nr:MAG: putative non-structural protein [Culex tenui-like virus]